MPLQHFNLFLTSLVQLLGLEIELVSLQRLKKKVSWYNPLYPKGLKVLIDIERQNHRINISGLFLERSSLIAYVT